MDICVPYLTCLGMSPECPLLSNSTATSKALLVSFLYCFNSILTHLPQTLPLPKPVLPYMGRGGGEGEGEAIGKPID